MILTARFRLVAAFSVPVAAGALLSTATVASASQTKVGANVGVASAPNIARVLHVSLKPMANVQNAAQYRTIGAAAAQVQPGDTVLIHGGVYRETVVVEKSGTPARPIRFEAAPNEIVTLTGADVLTDLHKEDTGGDNLYSVPWNHVFASGPAQTQPDDPYHLMIGRAEQVAVQGYLLHPVLARNQMSRGSFFVDMQNKRLYIWGGGNEDLTQKRVEATTRGVVWDCRGEYVFLRGVRVRMAANRAQQGAARFAGCGDRAEDCVFERTNGAGATFEAADQVFRRCTFQDNGQLGFRAERAHNLLFTECLVRNNNTKNFERGWEAGGNKIVLTQNAVLEKSRFIENRGLGIWFDIGNENCTVRNCLVANNEDAGLFYEISYGLHAHDNVFYANGLAETPGWWGGSCGLSLSSSPNCIVERNLFVGNKEGFNFREFSRTTILIDGKPGDKETAIWNHDETIQNNLFAYNRDAQIWGWFDTKDETFWPRAMQTAPAATAPTTTAQANAAAVYGAKGETAKPKDLTLEKLNFRFTGDLFVVSPAQELVHWGTAWGRSKAYTTLAPLQADLSFEQKAIIAPLVFADPITLDFRLPANRAAVWQSRYPRGEVPGVRLGIYTPGTDSRVNATAYR